MQIDNVKILRGGGCSSSLRHSDQVADARSEKGAGV